jgi:hypothetical protein
VTGVALDARGDFLVTWNDSAGDGSGFGVLGRRFHNDGTPRGGEFRVNTYTTAIQTTSAVGTDGAGNFVVGWASQYQDGSDFGVFAQRYGGLIPNGLSVDAQGNGILEPGEAVDLGPSWRNVSGAAQTFNGELSAIAGPAGVHLVTPQPPPPFEGPQIPPPEVESIVDCATSAGLETTRREREDPWNRRWLPVAPRLRALAPRRHGSFCSSATASRSCTRSPGRPSRSTGTFTSTWNAWGMRLSNLSLNHPRS